MNSSLLIFLEKKKYIVTVGLLYVGSVRRGGTKGWCYCVSLFSFHPNFSDFITRKKHSTQHLVFTL